MSSWNCLKVFVSVGLLMGANAALAGEEATVTIRHTLNATGALPPGLKTVALVPAEPGPAMDPKWSDLTTSMLQGLIQEAKDNKTLDLEVADRMETRKVFDEVDLEAAGMTEGESPFAEQAKLLGVQAFLITKVDVKEDVITSTKTGLDVGGILTGGRASTKDTQSTVRNLTVQTTFKLTDAKTGKNWDTFSASHSESEETKSSFIGISGSEGDLTPTDQIIAGLVEEGARDFLNRWVPVEETFTVTVEASRRKECKEGVQAIRADNFEEARKKLQAALAKKNDDEKAAFALAVVYEKLGDIEKAMEFYRKAYALDDDEQYLANKNRLEGLKDRIRRR
jgi:tetratricopeptide (TPR) repeat protein